MKPIINKRKCPAQKELCKAIQACPNEALKYVVDENEPLGARIVIEETLCDGCGLCAVECCGQAIEMI